MANKILLVEDNKTELDSIKIRFLNNGFEVECAENAESAFKQIFANVPDVIVTDVVMADLDGNQFCRLLKSTEITKNIPVVILTNLERQMDKFWSKNAGADEFLSKNLDFEFIKKSVEDVLASSKLTDENKNKILSTTPSEIPLKSQVNKVLEDLLMKTTFINEFRNLGEFYTHEKVLVEKVFELFSTFLDYDVAGLFFYINDDGAKNILYLDSKKVSIAPFVIEKIKREFFAKMPDMKPFNTNDFVHELSRENAEYVCKIVAPNSIKTSFIVPFADEDKLLGGIAFYSKNEIDYNDFKFCEDLEKELLTLFKMKSMYSEVEFLSVTDGLTGLYNRRYFDYNIEREFLRAKRYKNSLSMAILDIDFFKSVNDTYGHQYGDYVLKEVANIIKGSFRKTDMLYRYGGEEMTIIMPETSLENAAIPVERLREKIARHEFIYNGIKTKLTASIGISTMQEEFDSQKQIVESADFALYNAKEAGRNRVVIYNEQLSQNK